MLGELDVKVGVTGKSDLAWLPYLLFLKPPPGSSRRGSCGCSLAAAESSLEAGTRLKWEGQCALRGSLHFLSLFAPTKAFLSSP